MKVTAQPPRLAQAVLRLATPPQPGFDEMVGDLDQEYIEQLDHGSARSSARTWYWNQVLRSIPSLAWLRLESLRRPEVARTCLRACFLLLVCFFAAAAAATWLFSRLQVPHPIELLAYPAALVVAASLGAQLELRRSGDRDSLPIGAAVGSCAVLLVIGLLGSCAESPPPIAWAVWLGSALGGASLGTFHPRSV